MIKLFHELYSCTFIMVLAVLMRSTSRGCSALMPIATRTKRSFTAIASTMSAKTFETTPLGTNGTHLLTGLDVYSVPASGDDHPLAVYGIQSQEPSQFQQDSTLHPILLLHGRTWSSVPVFHLHLDAQSDRQASEESRSFMEALLAKGLQPYMMDFRGFGGTPYDESNHVEPNRCVEDTTSVLEWIAERHGMTHVERSQKPSLLGWSQGALIAQLAAQKKSTPISKVILYGSIYDPMVRYPREPLYTSKQNQTTVYNTFDAAVEDFTIEGTIPPMPACKFAEAALISDPIKARWKHLYQFNNCDPARINIPTLVLAGDQDPYAPLHVQQELFCRLGRASDRTWSILTECDHAVHLLEGRHRMTNIVVSFVLNSKQ
ncbi:hypothetical protein MPSEU_000068300 [Mayamaea pseudoterrestris]|nr:hypothetical protein MPSEU_000068300 [Mayamaea pseudoterrestris]